MKFYNLSPNLSNQTHQPPLYLRGLCSLFTMPFLISPHVILFLKSVTSASMVHPLIIQQANIYPFLVPKMFCEAFLYFFSQNINPLFEGHKTSIMTYIILHYNCVLVVGSDSITTHQVNGEEELLRTSEFWQVFKG